MPTAGWPPCHPKTRWHKGTFPCPMNPGGAPAPGERAGKGESLPGHSSMPAPLHPSLASPELRRERDQPLPLPGSCSHPAHPRSHLVGGFRQQRNGAAAAALALPALLPQPPRLPAVPKARNDLRMLGWCGGITAESSPRRSPGIWLRWSARDGGTSRYPARLWNWGYRGCSRS